MKSLNSVIKRKALLKLLLNVLSVILLFFIMWLLEIKTYDLFNSECIVTDESSLKACYKKSRYVKITTNQVYDAEYEYMVDGVVMGHFVDISVDGKSLIALVDNDDFQTLLRDVQATQTIVGRLENFTENSRAEAYNNIQNAYIERFEGPYTKEEVLSSIYPFQLNSYNASKEPLYINFTLLIIPTIILIILAIRNIIIYFKPELHKIYYKNKTEIKKLAKELSNEKQAFNSKKFIITENYIVSLKGNDILYWKIKDITWLYETVIRRLGFIKHGTFLNIFFKDKSSYKLDLKDDEQLEIMKKLKRMNPDIVIGYTKEKALMFKKVMLKGSKK